MAKKKDIGELTPGSKEWMNAFDALSPTDQASIFNSTYANPTDQGFQDFQDFGDTGAFPGGGGPALAGTSYNAPVGTEDISLDPMYQQILQMRGGVNIPQLTSSGKLDPYDLSQEASRVNLMQDQATSMADVILAALGGPGTIDPSSFQPDITMPTDTLSTPGLLQAQSYAKGGGWQGFIADRMLNKGLSDAEATADMWDLVSKPESEVIDPKLKAARQEIVRSLPKAVGPSGASGQDSISAAIDQIKTQEGIKKDPLSEFDQIRVNNFASDIYGKVTEDLAKQQAGWQDPQTHKWYTAPPSQEPSALTNKFRNLGLPLPTEQYTDPKYRDMLAAAQEPGYQTELQDELARNQANQVGIAGLQRQAGQANDYNMQVQALLNDPRNRPTPAGVQTGRPWAAMNTVTQYAAPGALTAGTPVQTTVPAGAAGAGRPTITPGISAADAARNVGANQINAALTHLASQPNQPERPSINPIFSFQTAQGQPQAGTLDQAQQGAMQANWLQALMPSDATHRGLGTQKPKRLDQKGINQAAQASAAARKAYENAYAADWNQRQNVVSPARGAQIDAIANSNFAASQGRTPLADVFIQRLLAQRAQGVR